MVPRAAPYPRLLSEPGGPSRFGCARCSRAPPHPAPCRSPRALACPVKGLLVASSHPLPPFAPLARRSRWRRERCVSPTSATDFVHEHPADCSIPGLVRFSHASLRATRIAARGRTPAHPGLVALRGARHGSLPDPLAGCADQVELRLTANLLLRPSSQPSREPRRVARGRVITRHVSGRARSWRGHDRRPLRAMPPVHGVFDRAPGLRRRL